jgi:DNA repair photolyase
MLGRGASIDPPNRFEPVELDLGASQLDEEELAEPGRPKTRVFVDQSRSALAYNQSPDIPFEVSLNPYRGCEHGCAYCYARPFHEYLGLSAGLDFETKIFAKPDLPQLLRSELAAARYRPSTITISGVTDGYQPVERGLRIVRGCLEVLAEARHPVNIITKSHLVTRDIDLLKELARVGAARVDVSLTTLDPEVSRRMEPRAASPRRRLEAVASLAEAGIPVGVICAPIVPGLTDHELPGLLKAAASAGAKWAHLIPLRLPGAVEAVFCDWLERHYPDRSSKVLSRQRQIRGGRLNDSRFGHRFRGQGPLYEHLAATLDLYRRKLKLDAHGPKLSTSAFIRPAVVKDPDQLRLF